MQSRAAAKNHSAHSGDIEGHAHWGGAEEEAEEAAEEAEEEAEEEA